MFVHWLRKLFAPRTHPLASERRARHFRPEVLQLEDRLAPAVVGTLSQSGSILTYTGTSVNNVISIAGTDAAFTITDTAGEISTAVFGFSGSGTSSVSGPIPLGVTTIVINGGGGIDSLTVSAAVDVSAALQTTADTTNVNSAFKTGGMTLTAKTGGVINLNNVAGLDTTHNAVAGNLYVNGAVSVANNATVIHTDSTLTDGTTVFYKGITGPGGLAVNAAGLSALPNSGGNFTAMGIINLGGAFAIGNSTNAGANAVALYQPTLAAGGPTAVSITANNAITFYSTVSSASNVFVFANADGAGSQGFTQTAGDIVSTGASPNNIINIEVNNGGLLGGGAGNASVRGLSTTPGGHVIIQTVNSSGSGGAILDGNSTTLNVNTGAAGTLFINSNGAVSLDTRVASLTALGNVGDINIRNSGLALTVATAQIFTSGNISIANNNDLTTTGLVKALGAGKTVTLTTSAGNVAINSSVAAPASVTINSAGNINTTGGSIAAPTINLSAATGIGTSATLTIGSAATVSAATTSGGIDITDANNLTVASAVAGAGNVKLTTTGASDLTTTGAVSAADGSTVTLTAGRDLFVTAGAVSTVTGAITLTPTRNLTIGSGATIKSTSGGAITVTAPTVNTVLSIAGSLLTSNAITINGGTGAGVTTSLTLNGSHSAGSFTVQTAGTGATSYNLAGTVTTSGAVAISATGALTLQMSGTLNVGATTTISAPSANSSDMTLSGNIYSSGNVVINGSGTAATSLKMSGLTMSSGAAGVAINGGTTGSLFLNETGTITATQVTITGSSAAANTILLNGSVTASTGDITIDTSADTVSSSITINGVMSATAGTTRIKSSSSVGDSYVVTPSTTSTFTFTFNAAGNTLTINTAVTNITAADASFSAPITFTAASGFQSWTNVGSAGTVTVSPTVP